MLKGSIVALITPFDKDGNIDWEGLEKLLYFHIEKGTDAILVLGTTGEPPALSEEEKDEIFKFVSEKIDGKLPLIAGAGTNNTQKVIENIKKVRKYGYEYFLIVTPYYNKPTQEGLFWHYSKIIENTDSKIIIYNVPGRTGCNILPETVLRIRDKYPENVVAVKEASGKLDQVSELVRGGVEVLSGDDGLTLPMLSVGAKGVISVFANVLPDVMHSLVSEYLKGNVEKSREIHLKYFPLMKVLFIETNPAPVKYIMNLMKLPSGKPRLPLVEVSDKSKEKIKKVLEDLNLI